MNFHDLTILIPNSCIMNSHMLDNYYPKFYNFLVYEYFSKKLHIKHLNIQREDNNEKTLLKCKHEESQPLK